MPNGALEAVNATECRVSGELSLGTVPELRRQGDEWLSYAATRCRMDLAGAEFVGSAGVALLIAWMRAAVSAGKDLTFVNPPQRLLQIARISGTDQLLGLTAEGAGEG